MPEFLSPENLVSLGYIGLFIIVFAETGLLVGFFLPGDSLLLTAGLLASQDKIDLNIWWICAVCFVAAVLGDATGYWFGKKVGRGLFTREESRIFKPKHLVAAQEFFEHHGGRAVVIARFMPIVRTFVPVVAGIGTMPYRSFVVFNVVGALLWAIGVPLLGYFIGEKWAWGAKHFEIMVIFVIFVSLLPSVVHVWKEHGTSIRAKLGIGTAKAEVAD